MDLYDFFKEKKKIKFSVYQIGLQSIAVIYMKKTFCLQKQFSLIHSFVFIR